MITCTSCKAHLNACMEAGVGDATDRPPAPGDMTFCLYCGHMMIFADEDGRVALRDLNKEEIEEVGKMPDLMRIAMQMAKRAGRPQ